jgi:multiple sugar transport system substrate-binding protein
MRGGELMKRVLRVLSVVLSLGLLAAACTAGGGGNTPPSINPSASHEPLTISIWIPFSVDREVGAVQQGIDAFQKQYPWITVKVTPGLGENDEKVLAAIRAGNPPDTVMSFSLDSVGKFCQTGAWQDLAPYMKQSGVDKGVFPASVAKYTSFAGSQCALPFLTDATGLYFNLDMMQKAEISAPPKTLSELFDDAKKLTVFNPDGSIKVAGFVPWFGYYEFSPLEMAIIFGADYYNADGTAAAIATDPDWAAMFEWQKKLVDFYGAKNLAKFVAGQGDEFSSANDFETGRIAMMHDGEWRTAFIADEAPGLNYGTAAFPVPDDRADTYGFGRVGGTIIGIPRGAEHPAEAWLLVQYLTTNTDTLVTAANTLKNVPSTLDALQSPNLDVPPQFKTFLDIFANPLSHYKQSSVIGSTDQNLVSDFAQKWQAGSVADLQAGLQKTAEQIDNELAQAGG